eukprot:jgi/Botrbrau1/4895/Bobra.118_1s0009.1
MTRTEQPFADRPPPTWHRKTSITRSITDVASMQQQALDADLAHILVPEHLPPIKGQTSACAFTGAGIPIDVRADAPHSAETAVQVAGGTATCQASPKQAAGQPTSWAQQGTVKHRRHASWSGFASSGKLHRHSSSGAGLDYEQLMDEEAEVAPPSPRIAAVPPKGAHGGTRGPDELPVGPTVGHSVGEGLHGAGRPGEGASLGAGSASGDHGGTGRQEPAPLISLEEPAAGRDEYRAVATPDGRQALLRKAAGGDEGYEVVLMTGPPAVPTGTPTTPRLLQTEPAGALPAGYQAVGEAAVPAAVPGNHGQHQPLTANPASPRDCGVCPSAGASAAHPPSASHEPQGAQQGGLEGRRHASAVAPGSTAVHKHGERPVRVPPPLIHPGPLLSPRRAPPPPPCQAKSAVRLTPQGGLAGSDPFGGSAVW